MICAYKDPQCNEQGLCNCRPGNTSEAAVGLGGLVIWLLVGIVASFLYPAIKILRSPQNYEANGAPQFAGTVWLFLSPPFGFLSHTLYQILFAAGACALDATQSKITGAVYAVGMFVIYILAMGLALLAFLFRNWKTINLFFDKPETRTGNKTLTIAGAGVMTLLILFAGLGIAAAATGGYFSHRTDVLAETERQEKIISDDTANYDRYVGRYKLITRDDDTLFRIMKSDDGRNLRLIRETGKEVTGGKSGCLLTPKLEGDAIYYAVSECVIDGKPSALAKVYFEIRKTRTVMSFTYNVRAAGDELEQIK